MKSTNKITKWLTRIVLVLVVLIVVAVGGFYIYTLDYYRADPAAEVWINQVLASDQLTQTTVNNLTITKPAPDVDKQIGIVFYPGGKVEAKAYLPLLVQLSQKGYTTILVKMPMNLAVFNINGALSAIEQVPKIDKWYIAGHSLGGAMASSMMEKHENTFKGMLLMGAYPLNDAAIPTLALYGTYDLMLDLEQVKKADQIVEIVDGNHAQFGNYGEQEGDGTAKISREDQQNQAVEVIDAFIGAQQ